MLKLLALNRLICNRNVALHRAVSLSLKFLYLLMGELCVEVYGSIVLRHVEAYVLGSEQLTCHAGKYMFSAVLLCVVQAGPGIGGYLYLCTRFYGLIAEMPYLAALLAGVGHAGIPNKARI